MSFSRQLTLLLGLGAGLALPQPKTRKSSDTSLRSQAFAKERLKEAEERRVARRNKRIKLQQR